MPRFPLEASWGLGVKLCYPIISALRKKFVHGIRSYGPDPVGGTNEAESLVERLAGFLKSQSLARELIEKVDAISSLGRKALALIDQELSKPVAPCD